jgi:hypothetical protein
MAANKQQNNAYAIRSCKDPFRAKTQNVKLRIFNFRFFSFEETSLLTMRLCSAAKMTASACNRPTQWTLACILLLSWSVSGTAAFVSSKTRPNGRLTRRFSQNSDDNNDAGTETNSIPQLPAIGASSFDSSSTRLSSTEYQPVALVGRKFQLQYTCVICETRNSHSVSRVAYRKGVVIATCKGCESSHLIADNLGWTDYKGGFQEENNIEEYFQNRGLAETVNRVSEDVFRLEKTLFHDSKSGSIVGDDGNPALE